MYRLFLIHTFEKQQEGHDEPWATFTEKMAVGMGQMETKVFPATFPEDFEVRCGGTMVKTKNPTRSI